jgi:hypothetical protein
MAGDGAQGKDELIFRTEGIGSFGQFREEGVDDKSSPPQIGFIIFFRRVSLEICPELRLTRRNCPL